MHEAIKEAVADAVANEVAADARKRRREAERRDREALAAETPDDPLKALHQRLAEIDEKLPNLRQMYQRRGDALAGRLIETLEQERAKLLAKIVGRRA